MGASGAQGAQARGAGRAGAGRRGAGAQGAAGCRAPGAQGGRARAGGRGTGAAEATRIAPTGMRRTSSVRTRPRRLYWASNYVYRSDDRGDSWTRISPDLTRN